jgi:deoxyribodipyrimidine photo-lyase
MQRRTELQGLQTASDWAASTEEAWTRLDRFLDAAGSAYQATRNYDLGPADRSNVSMLSPYIRVRLISEAEVVAAAIDRHGFEGARAFIREVCWRTYWKGWLEQHPDVWSRYRAEVGQFNARRKGDRPLDRAVAAAEAGTTGIDCFDSWALELVKTGFLHNHARMWFASIWVHTLNLPWQLGADFFLRHLLDGDAASNTLSWRWVCGLHTAGKTYLARAENIARYTRGRFLDAHGLAEEAQPVAAEVRPASRLIDTPAPVDGAIALLIGEDDLTPETLPLERCEVKAVIMLQPAAGGERSDRVARFRIAALDDARARAQRHFWCQPTVIALGERDVPERILKAAGGWPLAAADVPVGEGRDAVQPVFDELRQRGQGVRLLRRPWDARLWPLAGRGFFHLEKRLPAALADLGLDVT